MYVCSKQGNPCERLQGSAFENPITHGDDQRTKARTGRVYTHTHTHTHTHTMCVCMNQGSPAANTCKRLQGSAFRTPHTRGPSAHTGQRRTGLHTHTHTHTRTHTHAHVRTHTRTLHTRTYTTHTPFTHTRTHTLCHRPSCRSRPAICFPAFISRSRRPRL